MFEDHKAVILKPRWLNIWDFSARCIPAKPIRSIFPLLQNEWDFNIFVELTLQLRIKYLLSSMFSFLWKIWGIYITHMKNLYHTFLFCVAFFVHSSVSRRVVIPVEMTFFNIIITSIVEASSETVFTWWGRLHGCREHFGLPVLASVLTLHRFRLAG